MKVGLSGVVSLQLEEEWLFDGQPVPVSFVCDLPDDGVTFSDGRATLSFSVPVELALSEDEWSRAVGEVLAPKLLEAPAGDSPAA